MARALEIARRARHRCRPNPMVGAVLVRDGRILAEGWHPLAGGPHAERAALDACTEDPRGATLYVTLEPCGPRDGKRTAPCAPALVEAGLQRVVVATTDPHPSLRGRSLESLKEAGIQVEVGLMEEPARRLIEEFAWHATTGLPHITLKLALTLDGRIADRNGTSQWITGPEARHAVQRLRSRMDAILIGRGTADADDPSLTVRLENYDQPQPLRIVLGRPQREDLKLLTQNSGRTHLFHNAGPGPAGVRIHPETQPAAIAKALADMGVQRLLIEGGGRVAGSWLDAGLVQKVWLFQAPILLVDKEARPGFVGQRRLLDAALRLQHVRRRVLGPDLLVEGCLQDPFQPWASQ